MTSNLQVATMRGAWPPGRGSNFVKFPGGAKEKTVKMLYVEKRALKKKWLYENYTQFTQLLDVPPKKPKHFQFARRIAPFFVD